MEVGSANWIVKTIKWKEHIAGSLSIIGSAWTSNSVFSQQLKKIAPLGLSNMYHCFFSDKEIDLTVIETVDIKKVEIAGSHVYSSVSFINHFCKHFQVPFSVLEEAFNNEGEFWLAKFMWAQLPFSCGKLLEQVGPGTPVAFGAFSCLWAWGIEAFRSVHAKDKQTNKNPTTLT